MSSHPTSLHLCSAVVVGYHGDSRNLVQLAQKAGFGSIQELDEAPEIKRPEFPLTFFLVNHRLSDQIKGTLVRRLRRSAAAKIRFAPMVAIGEDVEFEVFLRHIAMGFDDFISLPEKLDLVTSRLLNQLGHPTIYIENANYFGPDRRRFEAPATTHEQRKAHPHSHTRLTIRRTVERGVEILQRQVFA